MSGEEAFLEARWIVAMNDWTSLLLAIAFALAACFNFATLRQLWLAGVDQREGRMLLLTRGDVTASAVERGLSRKRRL